MDDLKKNITLTTLIFCFLFFTTTAATAQNGRFIIEHYNTENGLPQNSVSSITVDKEGFTWLTTEDGLVRFDGQTFRTFNSGNSPAIKETNRMRMVLADNTGRIFFRNYLGYLYEIKNHNYVSAVNSVGNSPALIAYPANLLKQNDYISATTKSREALPSLAGMDISLLYVMNEKDLYAGRNNGDVFYMQQNGLAKKIVTNNFHFFIIKDTFFSAAEHGFFEAFYKGEYCGKFNLAGDLLKDKMYSSSPVAHDIFFFPNTSLLRSEDNYYTIERKGNSLMTTLLFSDLHLPNVTCASIDTLHHQYLFGTPSDGLYIAKIPQFRSMQQEGKNTDSQSNNVFAQQLLLNRDEILADRGILFDRNGNIIKKYSESVSGAFTDHNNQHWYQAGDYSIYKTDGNLKPLLKIPATGVTIWHITEDVASGNMWCCSENQVFAINLQQKKLELLADIPMLSSLAVINTNQLWIGRTDGLFIYTINDRSLKKIPGSDGKIIRAILEDKKNNITWVSTYGQGPFYVKDGTLYALPVDNAGKLLTPHCFVEDDNGFFWIPTNNGLFRVLKKEWLNYIADKSTRVYYQYYNNEEGFASNEFNGGPVRPFIKRADGLVSLPSMKGLVWFYPDSIPIAKAGRLFIDNIKTDTNTLSPTAEKLELAPDYGLLTFTICIPYYGNKDNLILEYQIGGLSDKWNTLPENMTITIPRLSHGDYVLNVRSLSEPGGKYQYVSRAFTVLKPWYKTWWFYGALFLLIAIPVALLIRMRLLALQYRKKEKETMMGLVLHDLRSPIRFMNTVIHHIAKNPDKISAEDLTDDMNELKNASSSLNDFTDQFFTWVSSQHKEFKVNKTNFPLQAVFNDTRNLYVEIIAGKGNSIEVEPVSILCFTDKNIIQTILRNIVDNANKNTTEGIISLKATRTEDMVYITVTDTGKGMEQEMADNMLKSESITSMAQMGYRMIVELAKKINGIVSIKSSPGKGTSVSIAIPATGSQ